ncbi:hypothetical protein SARC_08648 [Sphaeroforma arctica JP610]|uniref:dolichyl-P-Man:Man5GlcNAc2-PP-dolichol alpha-1,3-mannosyltransferase n=1 Tax=Sphaeroforma arctica JP610 TaxID=667725 RepID=A0A0L0FQW5_9EUKA|nr:hypothetical protein SARC_08648 [Sphaeroforma arctica JP610]KNC78941.1 hypothetical protein SARC_08648 [Sphaeroforma arctica JP610]|eukprot:XP_014152843.1 hypothetical protein SARC_08648 [Sphaeroforma arctica JP610]
MGVRPGRLGRPSFCAGDAERRRKVSGACVSATMKTSHAETRRAPRKLEGAQTQYTAYVAILIVVAEIPLNMAIIELRKYTEIDWVAYMQEVEGVENGEYDYSKLYGNTGPLVYPAGFVYIFYALRHLTNLGEDIRTAQYIFAGLYVVLLSLVLAIYIRTKRVPPGVLVIMSFASYRIHSIFVLRLFNDPVAMLFAYGSFLLFLYDYWDLGCFVYSLAVSIKMNVLLFAPGLLVLLWRRFGFRDTIPKLLVFCALPQVILALPFLLTYPKEYMLGAFNLGRVFAYEWTVNWRFLAEETFLDKRLHLVLLALHILSLTVLLLVVWTRPHGGLWTVLTATPSPANRPSSHEILFLLFSSNYAGMCFSRSLHYQFYVWYYHTIPYLLWSSTVPLPVRFLVLIGFEWAWNTYPSTSISSGILLCTHLVLLAGLITASIVPKDSSDSSRKALVNKKAQ